LIELGLRLGQRLAGRPVPGKNMILRVPLVGLSRERGEGLTRHRNELSHGGQVA